MTAIIQLLRSLRPSPTFTRACCTVLVAASLMLAAGCVRMDNGTTIWEVLGLAKRHVIFKYEGKAEQVSLVGDFNDWSTTMHTMERKGPCWSVNVSLPPGSYKYAFLVNDKNFEADPNAMAYEDDGFGGKNSILVVE